MGVGSLFDISDVLGALRVANRLREARGAARRAALLAGVCEVIRSPVGLLSVSHDGAARESHLVGVAGEPGRLLAAAASDGEAGADPAYRRVLRRVRGRAVGATVTHTRRELLGDKHWYGSAHVRDVRRSVGLDDCLYSAHIPGPDRLAIICVSRGWGRAKRFGERERRLVDALHRESAWVYRDDAPALMPETLTLSPRARQTLLKLLAGRGEKQIAAEMRLSVNTVHHYVKAIYRSVNVSSRAELLAKWMAREA